MLEAVASNIFSVKGNIYKIHVKQPQQNISINAMSKEHLNKSFFTTYTAILCTISRARYVKLLAVCSYYYPQYFSCTSSTSMQVICSSLTIIALEFTGLIAQHKKISFISSKVCFV